MTALLAGAALTGLVGSLHCIGMCGPFAVACGTTTRGSLAWHTGRLTTYGILGAIAGTVGHALPGPPWLVGTLSTVMIIWFAGTLAGWFPEPHVVVPGLARLATQGGDDLKRIRPFRIRPGKRPAPMWAGVRGVEHPRGAG